MSRRRARRHFQSDDNRPPLARLAALAREPGPERAKRMMTRIRFEVDRSGAPGPWIAAARSLAADGVITADAALFLVEAFLDAVTYASLESDPEMVHICQEMDRVKREHGLEEDEEWYVGEGPEEFERLNDEWERRDHENRIAALRALGHGDLADLLEREPEEFDRRTSIGHREFWGDRLEEEFEDRPELN